MFSYQPYLNPVVLNLLSIAVGAFILYLLCDHCLTFVFYMIGFVFIIVLTNLYLFSKKPVEADQFNYGETLMTKSIRESLLNMAK